jgi:hypothetical protein
MEDESDTVDYISRTCCALTAFSSKYLLMKEYELENEIVKDH